MSASRPDPHENPFNLSSIWEVMCDIKDRSTVVPWDEFEQARRANTRVEYMQSSEF